MLTNLTGNSAKFTERGEVGIHVRALRVDERHAELEWTVFDTGIGIPEDKLESLFDPFEQGDRSTTRKYGGTGLGLAICKDIVELLGGRIRVESELGRGSRFRFVLPFERQAEEQPIHGAPEPVVEPTDEPTDERARERVRGCEVLVVEDNPVNQRITSLILERLGAVPTLARDGQVALDTLARRSFDVVLMDCQMPVKDGYQATEELRAREAAADLERTTVIALTANCLPEERERCRRCGMDDFLPKPFTEEMLVERIAAWLEHRTGPGAGDAEPDRARRDAA